MNIQRNLVHATAYAVQGNARVIRIPIFGASIESLLNAIADAHERAKLVSWSYNLQVWTIQAARGGLEALLAMLATSEDLSASEESATAYTYTEDALDALLAGNEYGYQLLGSLEVSPRVGYGDADWHQAGSIKGTYIPPKGTVGLFHSEEQKDEPEAQSYPSLLLQAHLSALAAGDTVVIQGYSKLVINVQEQSVRLIEV